jgi:hypothetical protein
LRQNCTLPELYTTLWNTRMCALRYLDSHYLQFTEWHRWSNQLLLVGNGNRFANCFQSCSVSTMLHSTAY